MARAYHHALPAGTRIESYEVRDVLGLGGFGITYKAYDRTLERVVAIKEYLPTQLAVRSGDGTTVTPKSDGDVQDFSYGLRRFLDEARTLARFNERSIVRVIAYMEAHGTAYFVMDYEDGECLDARLKAAVTLAENEILDVVVPILRGLRVVHAQNFLHRDIKPLNIYVRRDGSPVLLDFGAAREALGEHSRVMTRMVTPGYAPFEQYMADGKQGPWSDIYALGATVYHCAVGIPPLGGTERVAALHDGEADPVRHIAGTLKRKLSAPFVDTMLWMLEPTARNRPQSVDEVLAVLEGGAAAAPARPSAGAGAGPATSADAQDVDLDAPLPATGLPAETLQAIELSLAQHIGPMSRVLVNKAAAQTTTVAALTELLSRFIDSEPARTSFLAQTRAISAGVEPAAGTAPASKGGKRKGGIDPRLLAVAQEQLALHLGPVAGLLVKRAAASATDADSLGEMLAGELSDPAQRAAFLRALAAGR